MKKSKVLSIIGFVLALTFMVGAGFAEARERCPENFVFLVDQSGSMYMHSENKELKMGVAKQVLLEINDLIPQADYNSALQLMAPVQEVYPPARYDRSEMGRALKSIKDEQDIFGRLTPMGPGIMSLDPVLARMRGNTDIILASDGMANLGPDPVGEARALYSKYPDVCIHIISLADAGDTKGKAILQTINRMNTCSIMVDGFALAKDQAALAQFVADVFCTPKKVEKPAVKEEVLILRGIQFDFDKYDIKPEWSVVLQEGVQILQKRPNMKVIIEGYCDGMGSIEYNQRLSERRARAVYDYFVARGIKPYRLQTIGYGKSRPKADNATEEGRAINRRVELKVVD